MVCCLMCRATVYADRYHHCKRNGINRFTGKREQYRAMRQIANSNDITRLARKG